MTDAFAAFFVYVPVSDKNHGLGRQHLPSFGRGCQVCHWAASPVFRVSLLGSRHSVRYCVEHGVSNSVLFFCILWIYPLRMHTVLLLLLALVSEVLGTLAGFGSSTFFVPLAHYLVDFQTVLAITAVLHVFSNAAKLLLFRKDANWRLALLFVGPGLLLVVLGAWLSQYLDVSLFELLLGVLLASYAGAQLLGIGSSYRLQPRTGTALVAGGIAGFVTGLLGTGGAIRAAGLLAFPLNKATFVATSALADFFTDSGRAVVYLYQGYLRPEFYVLVPLLLVIGIVGSWLGRILLRRVPEARFRIWVRLLLLGIGLSMVVRSVLGWLG